MSDGGLNIYSTFPNQLTHLLSELDNNNHKEYAALIIEDIDQVYFQALATRFAASLDVRFLAQHVLHLGKLITTSEPHDGLGDLYRALVARVDEELSRRLSPTTFPRDCCHIDGHIYSSTIYDSGPMWQVGKPVSVGNGYRTEDRVM
jgi:hypothetical protein